MDTQPFTPPPLPPASENGHKNKGGANHLHYYSQRDEDRETTRYLAAATQISLDYARIVVSRVIHEPYRALAPAYGADVAVVARWAMDSLRRMARRDAFLTLTLSLGIGLCWLFSYLLTPQLLWVSVGVLITLAAAFLIVFHEYWIRWFRVLGRQMLIDKFSPAAAPRSPTPRLNQRIDAIKDRRNGNLIVFREHAAFAGSGRQIGREQLVIDVSHGKQGDDGSTSEPGQFTNAEVHAALLDALNSIRLRDMHVGERVFVNGKHVRGHRGLQRHPLEPPLASVSNEVLTSATEHPTPDARAYVCAEIHGWQGQLMVTMFARAVHTGGWLYVEYSFHLLPPIKWPYMVVDFIYDKSLAQRLRKAAGWSIRRVVPALVISPFALVRLAAESLSWRIREATQARRIERGQNFDYGALPSIREDASGRSRQHYFLARDETMYLLLLQKSLLREIGKFLDKHNIALHEFQEQAKVIIDASYNNYSMHIGTVSDSTFAFGEKATANNQAKPGSA